jgi:glucosamine-6-phosphate deaminase
MNLTVFPTAQDAAAALAESVVAAIRAKPDLVLGLPTGRTPVRFYRELVRHVHAGSVDPGRITTFNLDEFMGIGPDEPGSYRQYMERHLFRPIGLAASRVHFLDGSAKDAAEECARYERAIAAAGGIDLQVLGIGANGHIGFNEPGEWLVVRSHVVTLRPETRRANALLFGGDPERVPPQALSMGVGTIVQARRIVLLATGIEKARAVERMARGRLATSVPASLLQLHAGVEIVLDRPAASRLAPASGLQPGSGS